MGMYNPYIERPKPSGDKGGEPAGPNRSRTGPGPLGGLFRLFGQEQKDAGMTGILKTLGLEQVDTGDILLLLILLLLVTEGDDMEMVVTLALMLLMGLGDKGTDQV